MYIPRKMEKTALQLMEGFPCLAVTGARQSGKTTLARYLFPEKPYVSLEDPDQREFAENAPRSFLDRFPDGALFDEAQRVPIQVHRQVGERRAPLGRLLREAR